MSPPALKSQPQTDWIYWHGWGIAGRGAWEVSTQSGWWHPCGHIGGGPLLLLIPGSLLYTLVHPQENAHPDHCLCFKMAGRSGHSIREGSHASTYQLVLCGNGSGPRARFRWPLAGAADDNGACLGQRMVGLFNTHVYRTLALANCKHLLIYLRLCPAQVSGTDLKHLLPLL